ncbi:MAG: preprotein translocase subunit SecY, partial [Candidatus Omnitrophota bacterium]|nr:preprotein translocase subunit SecY [Candidatus Omnitrophota bacterium]
MLQAFINSFKIPDLRKKLFFTLLLLAIYRVGAYIPTPGVNGAALIQFFNSMAKSQGGGLFGIMDMFSGGALTRLTIFALGIMPYISASIILQLLVTVVPYLEKLSKEGEAGRRKMIQYTRYGTIVLSVVQAFFISMWLENPARFQGLQIVDHPGWAFRALTVITLTTGTAFIMWIGEQIQEHGIGNGISLVITAGIISRLPTALEQVFSLMIAPQKSIIKYPFFTLILMSAIGVAVVVAVILITQGQRKIPVQYAKRIVGRKV